MKFALIDGIRQKPQPRLSGECPGCSLPVVAKCGKIRVWHWAHRDERVCDPRLENETKWHRDWKDHFPEDWQEIIHLAESGERHIADVKTDQGYVLEFQHSHLHHEERLARNNFYKKLVWVVDGTRLKRDRSKFDHLLKSGRRISQNVPVLRLSGFLDECALLRDWAGTSAPVFFDFGEAEGLWYLVPKSSDRTAYVVKFSRPYFVQLHSKGEGATPELDFWFNELSQLASSYELIIRTPTFRQPQVFPQRPTRRRFSRFSRGL